MLKIRHWAQSRGDFNATKAAPLMWNACPKAAVGWVHGELVTEEISAINSDRIFTYLV